MNERSKDKKVTGKRECMVTVFNNAVLHICKLLRD